MYSSILTRGAGVFRENSGDRVLTDPLDPDTDDDGWWDGWVGVYDAGRTDNVVLYWHHLKDDDGDGNTEDDGVQGHEVVPEQAEIHEVPSDEPGADIDGDGVKEHSNVHLGEKYWGSDPTEPSGDVPSSISVEVDWAITADQSYNRNAWSTTIENNYGLYGIEVNVIRDDVLSEDQLTQCLVGGDRGCTTTPDNGFGYYEIAGIGDSYASEGADLHVLVLDRAGGQVPGGSSQSGVKLFRIPQIALFTDGQEQDVENIDDQVVENSPYETKLGLIAGKTLLHEIGHEFQFGELDDAHPLSSVDKFRQLGEVYSGASDDPTPEVLASSNRDEWSIMASGYDADMVTAGDLDGSYFAFSIEELSKES